MGNYVSCTLPMPLIKNSKAARVIFPGGEIRQLREPVKAAELMLELPNYFLANSQSLQIGRRFSPLSADEDLEFGNVYIMFPMKRANSVVTAADMAVFFMSANSAAKRISGGNNKIRILPESGSGNGQEISQRSEEEEEVSRLSVEGVVEGLQVAEYNYRLSMSRSKKPMLETIKEEPIRSRYKN